MSLDTVDRMVNPLTTIVIPTFNDAPVHLAEAVQSAQAQTYPEVEIIVVDDGSHVPVKVEGIQVIRQGNAGPAAAMNAGIQAASGVFVVTLGGDDRLSPNYVQEAVTVLQSDAAATVAYPRVQEFGEETGVWWPGGGRDVHLKEFAVHSPITGTSAFRRADWETIGGFDESLRVGHEDYEFWVRLLGRCGGHAAGMPTATLFYRICRGSRARTQWAEARANTREAIVNGASRESLATLLTGAEEHARQLEIKLARVDRDPLNLRSWPRRFRRMSRRIHSRLNDRERTLTQDLSPRQHRHPLIQRGSTASSAGCRVGTGADAPPS